MAAFSSIMQLHLEPLTGQYGNSYRRIHINEGTPWNMADVNQDETIIEIYKKYADLRMKLMPYIQSEAGHCRASGRPLMSHLIYDSQYYKKVVDIEDQYKFGRSLLVCPITKEGERQRNIYLPEGEWYDFWSGEMYVSSEVIGDDCPLDKIPVFCLNKKSVI